MKLKTDKQATEFFLSRSFTKLPSVRAWTGIFLGLFFIIAVFSCNLFITQPKIPGNLEDPNAQLTAFVAVPSGDKSIVTMWNWRDVQSGDPSFSVDEIEIVHSTFGFLDFYVPFAGESFKDNSVWKYDWTGLDPSKPHYFSLFIKNGDGDWLPSYKMKVTLPGKTKPTVLGLYDSLQVKDSGTDPYIESKTINIVVQSNGPPNFVHVVKLDISRNLNFTKATILSSSVNPATEGIFTPINLRVFPVIKPWNENVNSTDGFAQLDDNTRSDYAVDDTVSAFIDKTPNAVNDVTDVIRKAILSNTNQIVFKPDKILSTNTNSVGAAAFITIDYVQ